MNSFKFVHVSRFNSTDFAGRCCDISSRNLFFLTGETNVKLNFTKDMSHDDRFNGDTWRKIAHKS